MIISERALDMIRSAVESKKVKFGDNATPAITWVTSNSGVENFIPHITVAIYTTEKPKNARPIFCNGIETEVLNVIPINVVDETSFMIDIVNGRLGLSKTK